MEQMVTQPFKTRSYTSVTEWTFLLYYPEIAKRIAKAHEDGEKSIYLSGLIAGVLDDTESANRLLDKALNGNIYFSIDLEILSAAVPDVSSTERRLLKEINDEMTGEDPIEYTNELLYPILETLAWKTPTG